MNGSRGGADPHPDASPSHVGIEAEVADHSDFQLVVGVARECHHALAETYSRHGASVHVVARGLVGTDRADDVVHDVFLRLWHDPERFDPACGSLRTFLVTQTHSRADDLLGTDDPGRTLAAVSVVDSSSSPPVVDERALAHLVGDEAWRLLSLLGDGERHAIALAHFGGLSYGEVARLLDQPEGTVLSSIRRGMHHLRAGLSATEPDGTVRSERQA